MYSCSNCKKSFSKWSGKCENCGEWNTLVESSESHITLSKKNSKTKQTGIRELKVVKLKDLKAELGTKKYLVTGVSEFDNVLGGRIIAGQVILLAGSPGIGKSTLTLDVINNISKKGLAVLYIAGEESPEQISHRADRLKLDLTNVDFLQEFNVREIERYIADNKDSIDFIAVDSIQTLYSPDLNSVSGSVSQISECSNILISLAKGFSIPVIMIGHVTKTGDIAGPKILEHMVDTVLYFEGDKKYDLRILRSEKNRFGPADEAGIFRMTENGLKEVLDTKELFDAKTDSEIGSVYSMALEGNRPIVVEVQALASKTYFSNPRRATSGFDLSRLFILLAIIDKKLKLKTYEYDVYINIVGGITIKDSGLDLAIIKAIVSSIKNIKTDKKEIYFGEVSLTGELRKITLLEKRIKEAQRIGFNKVITSKNIGNVSDLLPGK